MMSSRIRVAQEPWRDAGDEQSEARTMTLLLPIPKGTGGNERLHWAKRYKARSEAKGVAKMVAVSAMGRFGWEGFPWSPVEIIIDWYGHNLPDPDNCISRLKPTIDGLVAAGVIPDDSAQHIRGLRVRRMEIDRKNPRVALTVREYTE